MSDLCLDLQCFCHYQKGILTTVGLIGVGVATGINTFQNIIQENNIADIDSKLTTGGAYDDATLTALSKFK